MRLHGLDGRLAATVRADEKGLLPPLALLAGLYQADVAGDSPDVQRPRYCCIESRLLGLGNRPQAKITAAHRPPRIGY